MSVEPKILLSWEINPGYARPMRFSSRQVTACRRSPVLMPFFPSDSFQIDVWTPQGSYDLYEEVRSQTGDTEFDLVIVWSSCARSHAGLHNIPFNTKAFGCPTLLIAGDTHHMLRPIFEMLRYLEQERFDYVTSFYDRQHLHWFGAAGAANVGWFPAASMADVASSPSPQRDNAVCFFGHLHMHPVRTRILQRLQQLQVPTIMGTRDRASAALEYGRNLISLNCSLNGDLNLRTHEVLAAGGFLITDRLSEYSGFKIILESGVECETYSNFAELTDKILFYRRHPEVALRIARAGNQRFQQELRPDIRIKQILAWVTNDVLPDDTDPTNESRYRISEHYAAKLYERVDLYERVQERHRVSEAPTVLIAPDAHPVHLLDLADLPRLRIFGSSDDVFLRETALAWGLSDHIEWLALNAIGVRDWDCIVTGARERAGSKENYQLRGLSRADLRSVPIDLAAAQ